MRTDRRRKSCAVPARHVVEVAGGVDGLGTLRAERRGLQEVELDLGVRVEREAGVGRLRQRALQHVPRVGDRGLPVRRRDVAEHPRRGVDLAAPRQDLERGGVGVGEQVGFVRPRQALDRRAVESEALGERALDLGRRDRHRLQGADDVGEPEPDELDAALLDRAQNEVTLLVHRIPLRSLPSRPGSVLVVFERARGRAACSSSRRSSSAQARERSRMISGARAASSADVERSGAIHAGRHEPVLHLTGREVVPVLLAVAGHFPLLSRSPSLSKGPLARSY